LIRAEMRWRRISMEKIEINQINVPWRVLGIEVKREKEMEAVNAS